VNTLQLKIESRTDKLFFVRDFVSDAARNFGFDEESVSKIALAVDEACTNIIKHSYNYAPNKELEVKIMTNQKVFEVVITHQGIMFDPNAVQTPNMPEYLTHFRRGGLGMHLMKLLMDKIDYKILPNQTCEVHLLKRIDR
jgi:serine/threonine-protein kinase RsbW